MYHGLSCVLYMYALFKYYKGQPYVVHSYVTSHLDQNNSLLIRLPKKSLARLQMVQNATARVIMGLNKN